MPVDTQGKLLRVLVEQKFQRIGGGPKVTVDVRIVSSSSRDLEREMSQGRFRQDLFHRLNVVPLRVPSLIERREDIPELVEHFVKQIALSSGLPPRVIGDDATAVLQSHEWQGNVRQLRNIVERVMIMSNSDPDAVITADMLPDDIGANVPLSSNGSGGEHLMSLPLRDAREIFEREYLHGADQPFWRQHLTHCRIRGDGALGAAPEALGAWRKLQRTRRDVRTLGNFVGRANGCHRCRPGKAEPYPGS